MSFTKALFLLAAVAASCNPLKAEVIGDETQVSWSTWSTAIETDWNEPFSPAFWPDTPVQMPIVGFGNAVLLPWETFDPWTLPTSWIDAILNAPPAWAPVPQQIVIDVPSVQAASAGATWCERPPKFDPIATPEPGTFGLIGLGLTAGATIFRSNLFAAARRGGRRAG